MPNAITESIRTTDTASHTMYDKPGLDALGPPRRNGTGGDATVPQSATIELSVRNHPGAMSHITGLFARRAFNLEAIACAPIGDGSTSRMLLLVRNDVRLDQVERQLARLYDVLSVRRREDIDANFFTRMVR